MLTMLVGSADGFNVGGLDGLLVGGDVGCSMMQSIMKLVHYLIEKLPRYNSEAHIDLPFWLVPEMDPMSERGTARRLSFFPH